MVRLNTAGRLLYDCAIVTGLACADAFNVASGNKLAVVRPMVNAIAAEERAEREVINFMLGFSCVSADLN